MKTRKEIITEACRQRGEITQYFNDVDHWNETRGKTEGLIDRDPGGTMQRLADNLDAMLTSETERIAEGLYETYCTAVGGVAFNGEALPTWRYFRADPAKKKQSDAWVKTAIKAENIIHGIQ